MLTWYLFKKLIFSERAGSLVKRIAWLSLIGTGLSAAGFILVLSVMNKMNESIQDRALALEPHLVATVLGATQPQQVENHPAVAKLRQDTQLKVRPFETQDVILRTIDGQFGGAIARGMSESTMLQFLSEVQRLAHSKGQKMDFRADELPGPGEVMLGLDLARSMAIWEGDYLTVVNPESLLLPMGEVPRFEKVRVSRIISTNLPEVDARVMFFPLGKSLTLLRSQSAQMGVEIYMPKPQKSFAVKESLASFEGIRVETWQERNSVLFQSLKIEKMAVGGILALAALISGCAIITVLILLITQKRRDIAILKTIGLSNERCRILFVKLGVFLSVFGGGGGLVFGTILALYLEYNPLNILPDIYYDSTISARVEPGMVIGAFLVLVLLSLAASLLPAKMALEVEPAEALKIKD